MTRMTLAVSLGLGLMLAQAPQLSAQSITFGGDLQIWYTQMMDSNLRDNSAAGTYYNLRTEYKEDGFSFRRTELWVKGTLLPSLDYYVMIDPAINTAAAVTTKTTGTTVTNVSNAITAANPTILQDAFFLYHLTPALELKMGQFKPLQTYEATMVASTELILAERSQIARVFGDPRDRGVTVAYGFGSPSDFGAKLTLGAFNGMGQATGGKTSDNNAQKDFVARLEFNLGKAQRFGAYTLQGSTDQTDKTGVALAPTGVDPSLANWPSQAAIYDNKDKTTNLGAYYVYQDALWHFSGEVMTGLLGRRAPTLNDFDTTAGASLGLPAVTRQYLDQKFLGYTLTAARTFGAHQIVARYDVLNYNYGDKWYTSYDPYTSTATGPTGNDYTPRFVETTLGYTYALKPSRFATANMKINYIHRSKNFLKPAPGQTGAQGGDTLMAAFQIAF